MGKLVKYFAILLGGLALGLAAAILIVPRLVDVQKYKPVIEEKISAATGRKVDLGGEIKLSLFPWVGISLADFQIANPKGFSGDTFLRVDAFQAHVKVMPLLSREVYVDKIVLTGPELHLEKLKNGQANWEGLGSGADDQEATVDTGEPTSVATDKQTEFAIKSIEVGEFALTEGKVTYADNQQGSTTSVSDIFLLLQDVSLTRPLGVDFKAKLEGTPVGLQGQVGPLTASDGVIGKGTIPADLTLKIADQLKATMVGQLVDVAADLRYAFDVNIAPFSAREVAEALGVKEFPVQTQDSEVLKNIGLAMKATGTAKGVVVKNGNLALDDSKLAFEADVASFAPLKLTASGELDRIDLDRYLPPVKQEANAGTGGSQASSPQNNKATDYSALRTLTLDTRFTVGTLKVKGGTLENIVVQLKGNKGIFTVDPLSADIYSGKLSSPVRFDVRKSTPVASISVTTTGVQVGPALQDFADKDVLEGTLGSKISISFKGDTPEKIKKSLNGEGLLTFEDGAIVGIDLAGMVRNVQASFGLVDKPTEKPRTDFAELKVPFTIANGLVDTPGTTLSSPLLRVAAAGSAHLVTEKLDMNVRPKFVATLKGQGDTAERSGIMVPIKIGGTFSKPTFAPDLAGLVQGGLPDTDTLKEALQQELNLDKLRPEDPENPEEKADPLKEGIKQLIPQFKF